MSAGELGSAAIMQRYAQELYDALRLRGTRTLSIAETGRGAMEEVHRLDGLVSSARASLGPTAPRPAVAEPAVPSRAASLGLGVLDQRWPPHHAAALRELLEDIAAVARLWDPARTGGGEARRALDAIADRRDHAVRLASARMYESARSAGLGEPAVDAIAAELASYLGLRLYGNADLVFAARCGGLDQSAHELVGPGSASGTVRGAAFGIRSGDRSLRSKALVEAAEGGVS